MDHFGPLLLFSVNFFRYFRTVSAEKLLAANGSTIPHNISGLTNKTLDDGIDFSCESMAALNLPQSGVAGVFILSGIVLLSVGKCFLYLLKFFPEYSLKCNRRGFTECISTSQLKSDCFRRVQTKKT